MIAIGIRNIEDADILGSILSGAPGRRSDNIT
jgi:hypothetical protein